MKEKEIVVAFTLEHTDFNALRSYYMYKRTPQRTKFMVILLLVSLILLVISQTKYAFPYLEQIGLFGMLIIVATYSWISIDARKLERGAQELVGKKQEVTLTEEGFYVTWKGLSRTQDFLWTETDYVYEDDNHFFIFHGRHSYTIIAKLEFKLLKKENKIKELHTFIEGHANLVSDLSDYKYEKY